MEGKDLKFSNLERAASNCGGGKWGCLFPAGAKHRIFKKVEIKIRGVLLRWEAWTWQSLVLSVTGVL